MPSGASVHGDLVQRIEGLESRVGDGASEIEQLEAKMASLREREAESHRALAELHLPEMSAAAVARTLSEMRDRIQVIYEEKQGRAAELRQELPTIEEEVRGLESTLGEYTDGLNRIGEDRERLEGVVAGELEASSGWLDLVDSVRTAHLRVEATARRHEVALAERSEKVPAYEADTFFSYLAARRFGSDDSAGNVLTRRMDAWVADLTKYADARADYDVLTELPSYIASSLEAERAILDEAAESMRERVDSASHRHGLDSVLAEGEALYRKRETVVDSLQAARERRLVLEEELAAMDHVHGGYFEKAVGELQAFLESRELSDLLAEAQATEDPRDDAVVLELGRIEETLDATHAELTEVRTSRSQSLVHLRELNQLRHEFERKDWDGGRSMFSRALDLDDLVSGYTSGRHSARHVHQQLIHHHSFRPRVDHSGARRSGGGGFRLGGGFGSGGGRSSGGGGGGGRGGRSSGFRRGGGF